MKIKKKVPKASIIIANYNNAKYVSRCISSVLDQSYKSKEIIFVDDKSNDNSLEVIKKFKKKIKIIKNKKKTSEGSYNQINSYYKGYLKSGGKYIFFLDSDDYFKKDKIKLLIKKFISSDKPDLIFDLPILKFKNKIVIKKFKQKKFIISSWPRFSPQSCISVSRKFADEIFKELRMKKYETIWLDFRIATYFFLKKKDIFIYKKYLTYYRQLENSASKDYKVYKKKWWYRRKQAHDFISLINKKLNFKDPINIDKILTNIMNYFL